MSSPPPIKKTQKQTKNQNETKGNQKIQKNKQKQEIRTCISKQKNLANSLLVTYLM